MQSGVDHRADVEAGASDQPSASGLSRFCSECQIVKEADHRIANHLSMLAASLRLQAGDLARQPTEVTRESVGVLLQNAVTQIEAVARLHRSLILGGRRVSTDLAELLGDICAPLRTILSSRIALIEDFAPGCEVLPKQVLPLTQIVAEVINNAVKHAYPLGRAGQILIRSRKDETGCIVVEVIDDGPGFPQGFDQAHDGGLGFQVVRALSRQLGAASAFESTGAGTRFRLTLSVESAHHATAA